MRRGVLAFATAASATFCLGPFLWLVVTAVRPDAELTQVGLPSRLTLEHFRHVLFEREFLRFLWNSLLVASSTTLLSLALAGLAAFALAKLEFPGRQLLLGGALAISMFPPIATVSPLYLIVRSVGLRDSLAGLVIPYTTFALPLGLWIFTSFLRELPDELYRAARIDGCSPFQAFWKVLLPLSAPGVATTGILVFIAAWNEFLFALTFTSSPSKRTVPVAISLFAAEHKDPWGQIAAASVVATLPLVIVTLLFQRRIVAGLTAGAVKG
jgi:multiple sugar transport system permease protein